MGSSYKSNKQCSIGTVWNKYFCNNYIYYLATSNLHYCIIHHVIAKDKCKKYKLSRRQKINMATHLPPIVKMLKHIRHGAVSMERSIGGRQITTKYARGSKHIYVDKLNHSLLPPGHWGIKIYVVTSHRALA